MRLSEIGTFLTGAGKAAANIHRPPSQRALNDMRREHDEWARTVKPNIVYYTALPTLDMGLVNAGRISRPVHSTAVFTKRASWGVHTGQWLTTDNTPSWPLWRQYGPFTPDPQWTQRDQEALDAKLDAQASRGMAEDVLARFEASPEYTARMARLGRQYPATVAALAA